MFSLVQPRPLSPHQGQDPNPPRAQSGDKLPSWSPNCIQLPWAVHPGNGQKSPQDGDTVGGWGGSWPLTSHVLGRGLRKSQILS